MPTRNTPVLQSIIETLGDEIARPQEALARLEGKFKNSLLIVAGDIQTVARHAEELRLAITTEECSVVLDHLAPHIRVSIEQSEESINALFPDRFIEP